MTAEPSKLPSPQNAKKTPATPSATAPLIPTAITPTPVPPVADPGKPAELSLGAQVRQECFDFCLSHFPWMPLVVKSDISLNPLSITFFSLTEVMFAPNGISHTSDRILGRSSIKFYNSSTK